MSDADDSGFLTRWARRKASARRGAAAVGPDAQPAQQGAADTAAQAQVERSPAPDGRVKPGPASAARNTERVAEPAAGAGITAGPASGTAPIAASGATSIAPQAPVAGWGEPPPTEPPPLPTLDDVARLTRSSDYSRFVQPGVSADVRNAALKQLFTDPHFNVMDGLDTYIDDYGKPDPIPLAMLRKMRQSKLLGLFDAEDEKDGADPSASPDGAAPLGVAQSAPTDCPAPPPGASPKPPDDDADLRLQQDDGAGCAGPAPGARA
jgi:hypothetical protein